MAGTENEEFFSLILNIKNKYSSYIYSGVSEEYLYLYNLGLFNVDELNEIRKNSLK